MDKTILITGTTSGLGFELAQFYVEKDWNVIGLSRNPSKINSKNYQHYTVDIGNYNLLKETFIKINSTIDMLVNNAAIFEMKSFNETTIEQIDRLIDTNLKGSIYVTKLALNLMKCDSRIFFINSVAGINELENQSIYCSTKHGLTGFAGVLGKELQNRNIKVTSIHPGGINTPLWNEDNQYPCGDVSNAISPKEIANLIDFIYNSKSNIEYKTIKMFPDKEWH